MAAKQYDPAAKSFERAALLYPVGTGSHALRFLFPANSGLPRPSPAEIAAAIKEMDQLIAVTPNNRMIPLLKQGLEARAKGDYTVAIEMYRLAAQICPDEASTAGVHFLEAMCFAESSDLVHAGEKWEFAARCADFPQNQYAAGLSACAFVLDGHADSIARSSTVLQLSAAKNGPLTTELQQLSSSLSGKTWRVHSISKENSTPDDAVKTWVEIDAYYIPYSLRDHRPIDRARQETRRVLRQRRSLPAPRDVLRRVRPRPARHGRRRQRQRVIHRQYSQPQHGDVSHLERCARVESQRRDHRRIRRRNALQSHHLSATGSNSHSSGALM
jgi:tetratricopeptide (TPR) repeat protein